MLPGRGAGRRSERRRGGARPRAATARPASAPPACTTGAPPPAPPSPLLTPLSRVGGHWPALRPGCSHRPALRPRPQPPARAPALAVATRPRARSAAPGGEKAARSGGPRASSRPRVRPASRTNRSRAQRVAGTSLRQRRTRNRPWARPGIRDVTRHVAASNPPLPQPGVVAAYRAGAGRQAGDAPRGRIRCTHSGARRLDPQPQGREEQPKRTRT